MKTKRQKVAEWLIDVALYIPLKPASILAKGDIPPFILLAPFTALVTLPITLPIFAASILIGCTIKKWEP